MAARPTANRRPLSRLRHPPRSSLVLVVLACLTYRLASGGPTASDRRPCPCRFPPGLFPVVVAATVVPPPHSGGRFGGRRGHQSGKRQRERRRSRPPTPTANLPPSWSAGLFEDPRRWLQACTGVRLPRVHLRFEPVHVLKLRKAWRDVVPGAIVRVGADFEMRRQEARGGVWRIGGCVEDKWIGGRLSLVRRPGRRRRTNVGRRDDDEDRDDDDNDNDDDDGGGGLQIEYAKSWSFPYAGPGLGPGAGAGNLAEGLATARFDLRASYDLETRRAGARFGLRTERRGAGGGGGSFDGVGGTTFGTSGFGGGSGAGRGRDGDDRPTVYVAPVLPIDGPDGNVRLEIKTRVAFPRPEVVLEMDFEDCFSSRDDGRGSDRGSSLGMGIGGDVDVDVEEINVVFQY